MLFGFWECYSVSRTLHILSVLTRSPAHRGDSPCDVGSSDPGTRSRERGGESMLLVM